MKHNRTFHGTDLIYHPTAGTGHWVLLNYSLRAGTTGQGFILPISCFLFYQRIILLFHITYWSEFRHIEIQFNIRMYFLGSKVSPKMESLKEWKESTMIPMENVTVDWFRPAGPQVWTVSMLIEIHVNCQSPISNRKWLHGFFCIKIYLEGVCRNV